MGYYCEECRYPDSIGYPHSHLWWCDMCDNPWPHLHIIPVEKVFTFGSCDLASFWSWDEMLSWKSGHHVQIEALLHLICEEGVKPGCAPAVERDSWVGDYGFFVDGHHRLTVLIGLGFKWIPVQHYERHARDTPSYRSAKIAASQKGFA